MATTEETISAQVERYLWCLRAIMRDLHITPIEGTGPVDTGGEQYTPLHNGQRRSNFRSLKEPL